MSKMWYNVIFCTLELGYFKRGHLLNQEQAKSTHSYKKNLLKTTLYKGQNIGSHYSEAMISHVEDAVVKKNNQSILQPGAQALVIQM